MAVAHKFAEKARTSDVLISETVDFAGLLLSEPVLHGLKNSGFERPSPIQLKAIPLGRCGLDLIVQAKSGTGKTCVFTVIALESLQVAAPSTQVLVLAPTREIAIQIWEVVRSLGSAMPGLQCHTFIGGLPLHEDKKKLQLCHIAVGTPGRIQNLIEHGCLKTDSIRLFILDEADKLLEESFQEQINWIYSTLPDNKQMVALSATYPEYMADHLTVYMRNPTFIRLNISDPTLLGIKQYYTIVPSHPLPHRVFEAKTAAVIQLLSSVSFHQCLIFSNMQTRAQNLESELTSRGWPTTCIAGSLDQKDRITAMAKLKSYKCRVLISTDLTSRGIDADRVNLVINLDVPKDHETYLHRIGRAGRFGSYGAGVTIISEGQEMLDMQNIEHHMSTHILPLPDPIPSDLVKRQLQVNLDDVVSTEQLITRSQLGELPSVQTTSSPCSAEADKDASLKHGPCPSALGNAEVTSELLTTEPQPCGDISAQAEAASGLADAYELADASLQSSSSDPKGAVCLEQHASGHHSGEGAPAGHEQLQQSDATGLHVSAASAAQVDPVTPSSDVFQHSEGADIDKSEVTKLCARTEKIHLPESESVLSDVAQGDSPVALAETEDGIHSTACCEAAEGAWDSGLGLEKEGEEQCAEAKLASHPSVQDCDQVKTVETSDCSLAESTNHGLQVLAGEAPNLEKDHAALSPCLGGHGTVGGNQEKMKKSDTDEANNMKSNRELLQNSEKLSGSFQSKEACKMDADLKLSTEPEKPAVAKKHSKARSTAAIWTCMLSSELFVEEAELPKSEKDRPLSSELSSVEKSPAAIAAKQEGEGKGREKQSWDNELAMYLACRPKVKHTPDSEGAGEEEADTAKAKEVASRPKHCARRRLGTKDRKEGASNKQCSEQNELGGGAESPRESGSGVGELQRQHLPRGSGVTLEGAVPPSQDAGGGVEKDHLENRANIHSSELQTSAKSASQTPRQESSEDAGSGSLASKSPASSSTRRRQVKFCDAGREGHCDGSSFEKQPVLGTDCSPSVTLTPKISSSSGAASRSCISHLTYSSALQDYEHYLEMNSKPTILTAHDIVQKTFRVPEKVEQSQLEQIPLFLNRFHTEVKVKSQNSGVRVGFDTGISDDNTLLAAGNQVSRQENSASGAEIAGVGDSHWDGGDHALDKIATTSKKLPKGNNQSASTLGHGSVAESKSSEVKPCVRAQSSVGRGEEVADKAANSSARRTQRPQRYRPMAVCGPATEHLFGFKDANHKAGMTEDASLVSEQMLPHIENPSEGGSETGGQSGPFAPASQQYEVQDALTSQEGSETGGQSSSSFAPASEQHGVQDALTSQGGSETGGQGGASVAPASEQHGVRDTLTRRLNPSSLGTQVQEGIIATAGKHDGSGTKPCLRVQLQAQGKGAIPKKKLAEKMRKQEHSEDSSCKSSSTLSSSTSSDGDSSAEDLNEKNSMCFQNYYADESALQGRKKKLSSRALARRREQEEKMRKVGRMPSASPGTASKEQQSRSHQRGHSACQDAHSKMNPAADAAYSAAAASQLWQPYASQHHYCDHYSRLKPDRGIPQSWQSYPYPNSYPPYVRSYYQNFCPPAQMNLSSGGQCFLYPYPGYPSYQQQAPSYEEQYSRSYWQHYAQGHHPQHPFYSSGAGRPAADRMSAEKLADIQQASAQRLQQYIRKMARFYARFSKRDG